MLKPPAQTEPPALPQSIGRRWGSHLNPEGLEDEDHPHGCAAKLRALKRVARHPELHPGQLTRTCPDIDAAFATDVVKTLSAEDPTLATVTVVTSTREWNRIELHTWPRKKTKGKGLTCEP